MQHLIGHVPVKRRSRFRETAVTLWCNDGHFPVNSAPALDWMLINMMRTSTSIEHPPMRHKQLD